MKCKKTPTERRQELILTARKMFLEKGIENTTINAIVTEIGVAKGLFYYYFPSKNDIILAVIHQEYKHIENQLYVLITNPELSFIQKLSQFIELEIQLLDQFGPKVFRNMKLSTYSLLHEVINTSTRDLNHRMVMLLIEYGKKESLIHIQYSAEILLTLMNGYLDLKKHLSTERNILLRMIEEGLHLSKGCLQPYHETI